ncbi:hypothetical protein JWS13_39135 [Rhodococcus pseudokoreensis]|uniref:Rho termination factor, N-terminal domain n=1 Tax=Rhodococcus pseudokoreensis TaxID=2811421 RepID=A0A974WB95_9NOCA|nr:hypothetical protein [Rhodococcus pseudokoreensis]QSE94192.1 hypothetical protein JWS13_39135 [Rhodococcus pseudokoreensis]
MGRRLSAVVHVLDEVGTYHQFGPTDVVPDWAAAKITNPAAWAEDPVADLAYDNGGWLPPGSTLRIEDEKQDFPGDAPSDQWKVPELLAFAETKGIDLGDAKKKADILAAIAQAEAGAADEGNDGTGDGSDEGEGGNEGNGDGTA